MTHFDCCLCLWACHVLFAGSRSNLGRLRQGGGAEALAEAFRDGRLAWEAREHAAGLLQDLAAGLALDQGHGGGAAAAAAAPPPWKQQQQGLPQQAAEEGWGRALQLLVQALQQQQQGGMVHESRQAAAAVLAKFAAHGLDHAAAVREAGALPPLLHLLALHAGRHGAATAAAPAGAAERRTALAALQALESLVGEAGCQALVLEPCIRWVGWVAGVSRSPRATGRPPHRSAAAAVQGQRSP